MDFTVPLVAAVSVQCFFHPLLSRKLGFLLLRTWTDLKAYDFEVPLKDQSLITVLMDVHGSIRRLHIVLSLLPSTIRVV